MGRNNPLEFEYMPDAKTRKTIAKQLGAGHIKRFSGNGGVRTKSNAFRNRIFLFVVAGSILAVGLLGLFSL
jgi:hypothetical protein